MPFIFLGRQFNLDRAAGRGSLGKEGPCRTLMEHFKKTSIRGKISSLDRQSDVRRRGMEQIVRGKSFHYIQCPFIETILYIPVRY